jgi:hypothetical protein
LKIAGVFVKEVVLIVEPPRADDLLVLIFSSGSFMLELLLFN